MMSDATTLIPLSKGGVRWWIAPDYRDLLLGPAGLRLEEWLRNGQAHIVKKGVHRQVYRVELPGLAFFLKHNRVPDWKTWVRQTVRPSKARIEYDRICAVASRGVSTVEPLGLGEELAFLGAGESMLITRSLEDTQQLNSFMATTLMKMEPARRTALRHQLAIEIGKLVARLHEAGIQHKDLHPANILVRLEEGDRLVLFLIDLNAVCVSGSLQWPASRENLIILNRWFVPRSSRSDRLRFWRAYFLERQLGTWSQGVAGPRHHLRMAQDLERRTWTSNLHFWKDRDRRYLRTNRYFQRIRGQGIAGHAVSDLDAQQLQALLSDPDEPFRRSGVPLLKDSPSSTVVELEMLVDGRPRRVIYKRFRVTAWSGPWVMLVRPSAALRSWMYGQGFRDRCLPTARPLAVLHRRRSGLSYEGYLLTEKIENAHDLHGMLADIAPRPRRERQAILRRRIDEIARVIRELHRRHLSQRDLKATNILVSRDYRRPTSPYQPVVLNSAIDLISNFLPIPTTAVWLIDLVGVQTFRRLPRSRRVQNLARLNASFVRDPSLTLSDRLRFLRIYLQWGLRGRVGWKKWWREIAEATRRKVVRNLRVGRPLE
jgi:tRNA A-37 threonylcarbamoyl transferase component Bud32